MTMLLFCCAIITSPLLSGQNLAFRFQAGQAITYRIEQETTATDTMGDNSSSVKNRTRVLKRWTVVEVSPAGVATLEMRLLELVLETTRPNGEVLKFNSGTPDGPLKDSLAPLIGPVVARLKVDSLGRVLEVIESKFGKASRYETEPPFVAILHGQGPVPEQSWQRTYQHTLEPPAGTGEKVDLVQKYVTKEAQEGIVRLEMETTTAKPAATPADEAPLLQLLPKGTVVINTKTGLLQSAALTIDREVKNATGQGSTYRFQSSYKETLVER
jgi:hypothetical protein